MSAEYKFQGWLGLDAESVNGKMVWKEYEPKPFEETDVDIKITHSGVCGSDIHTLRSGWYPSDYPVCVGHEIVGHAVRVGSKVTDIKVGDRVGVGAQAGACMNQKGDCEACADGLQQHCPHMVQTYNSRWPDGSKSYGGYADYWRGSSDFVIPIPDGIPSDEAAPMLCGGVRIAPWCISVALVASHILTVLPRSRPFLLSHKMVLGRERKSASLASAG